MYQYQNQETEFSNIIVATIFNIEQNIDFKIFYRKILKIQSIEKGVISFDNGKKRVALQGTKEIDI